VCAGVADWFNIDVTIVRLIWMIMVFAGSFGFWLYLAMWLILPEKRDVVNVMREEDLASEMRFAKDAGYEE
jgi:phage shock protein PspC (stress-responsive transcriptional regulator)